MPQYDKPVLICVNNLRNHDWIKTLILRVFYDHTQCYASDENPVFFLFAA